MFPFVSNADTNHVIVVLVANAGVGAHVNFVRATFQELLTACCVNDGEAKKLADEIFVSMTVLNVNTTLLIGITPVAPFVGATLDTTGCASATALVST
jgi:short-subunit dehydrogenase